MTQVPLGEAEQQGRAPDAAGVVNVAGQVDLDLSGAHEGGAALHEPDLARRRYTEAVGRYETLGLVARAADVRARLDGSGGAEG